MKYGQQIAVIVILLAVVAQVFCGPLADFIWEYRSFVVLDHYTAGKVDWDLTGEELLYNLMEDTGFLIFTLCMHKYFKGWPRTIALMFVLLSLVQYINDCTSPYEFDITKLRWFVICAYLAFKWGFKVSGIKNKILRYLFD